MTEREIFENALEIPDPDARSQFLDDRCGTDQPLRQRLEQLLAAHEAEGAFLKASLPEQIRSRAENVTTNFDSKAPHDLGLEASDDAIDTSFLEPTERPGSLGRVAHYEVLELIGRGGFGAVFKAFDPKLERHVAIKFMDPRLASTSPPRKRFLREARSAAAIKHENIVQIHSVEENPIPYLVMEHIDGGTLQERINGFGPHEVDELLALGIQIASGLAAAHDKGLIHRDIKPSNILVENGSRIKITDFGLARAADDASLTRSGMIMGTPMYMAPEQALGQELDHRADLFSMGAVFYQMASGRPPFRAPTSVAVIQRVVRDTPRSIAEIVTGFPDWLETIIFKLLEKDAANRFQTAREVEELLRQCEREYATLGKVRCVTSVKRAGRTDRKSPAWGVMAIGVLIIVSVALGVYSISNSGNQHSDQKDPSIAQTTHAVPSTAEPDKTDSSPSSTLESSDAFVWTPPENLGDAINTTGRESYPTITTDELLLVFARQGTFWQATRSTKGEPFGNVAKLDGDFSMLHGGESSACLSGDGLTLVFDSRESDSRGEAIYLATRNDRASPFNQVRKLPPIVDTDAVERHPVLSYDGRTLAVSRATGKRGRADIVFFTRPDVESEFVAAPGSPELVAAWDVLGSITPNGLTVIKTTMRDERQSTTWHHRASPTESFGPPREMPAPLRDIEMNSVKISADGNALYFHSKTLPNGRGQTDLWMSRRVPSP